MKQTESASPRAGYSIPQWCAQVGISRPMFYRLDAAPRTVKLGKRHLVIEDPKSYLARIADSQLSGGAA